ncbi:gfo/Idh/MocA family oxidoreductase, partial [Thermococci archaeon]
FLESIIEDKEPPITGEIAKKNLEIILAAYESSKTGQVIKL